jgi:hypothetical protein
MIARARSFVARFHTCEFLARRRLLPGRTRSAATTVPPWTAPGPVRSPCSARHGTSTILWSVTVPDHGLKPHHDIAKPRKGAVLARIVRVPDKDELGNPFVLCDAAQTKLNQHRRGDRQPRLLHHCPVPGVPISPAWGCIAATVRPCQNPSNAAISASTRPSSGG